MWCYNEELKNIRCDFWTGKNKEHRGDAHRHIRIKNMDRSSKNSLDTDWKEQQKHDHQEMG